MGDSLKVEDIKAAINAITPPIDPRIAGMKEIESAFIPEGSHIYENDGYMAFYSDGNEEAFIYKKRDWMAPMGIQIPDIDDDIRRTRLWARFY